MNHHLVSQEAPSIAAIAAALGELACRFDVDVLAQCDSSNARLLERAETGAPCGSVLVACEQTAGRGRRGRHWLSAPGDSLTFSLLWRFPPAVSLAGLSLAVGVALLRALAAQGVSDLSLKWPNDLLLGRRKLAGVLIELLPRDPHTAVIGIGINLRLPAAMPEALRALSVGLDAALSPLPDGSLIVARVLRELNAVLTAFAELGFAPLRQEWLDRHLFQGQAVQLLSDFAPPVVGICHGVDVDGALLLETSAGVERVISGEISLRPA